MQIAEITGLKNMTGLVRTGIFLGETVVKMAKTIFSIRKICSAYLFCNSNLEGQRKNSIRCVLQIRDMSTQKMVLKYDAQIIKEYTKWK